MSWDDDYEEGDTGDDPVAVEPPVAIQLPEKAEVTVTVYAAQMQTEILRQVAAQVTALFKAEVSKAVTATVAKLVEDISREQIADAIRAILAEGWNITDEYGGPKGKASLKDRLSKMLNQQDRYSSHGAWAERIMREETEKALRGDIQKEIDAAKAKLTNEVDAVIKAKLSEVMRKALGVG